MLLGVILLIAGAVALGAQVASTRTLTHPAGSDTRTEYAQNAIGRLAPVSARFTERRLGRKVLGLAGDQPAPSSGKPTPKPVTRTPAESIHGEPGTFPGLAPGGFDLTIAMAPNHSEVKAGDEVRYRMVVTNTGGQDFRGRAFTLEWHTPTGTVGRNAIKQCTLLPLAIAQALCASQRLLFEPGLGEARHDSFNSAGLVAIGPGESFTKDWYVQVLPTAATGTTFLNHAHLTVSINGKDHTISTDDVTVTVVA